MPTRQKVIPIVLIIVASILAQISNFKHAGKLQCAGKAISASFATMCMSDWDGDGTRDLFIAHGGGEIRYYNNIGSNVAPKFNSYTNLKAGGNTIKYPST